MILGNRLPTRLSPEDLELWQTFYQTTPNFCEDILFDVRVGDGADPGETYEDNIRIDAIMLTQRRIDVVCSWPDRVWLIEITHTATLKAIGQLEVYPFLFQYSYETTLPIYPVLMYRHCDGDLLRFITVKGINTLVIP
jgi:hypothetical protein